jgi:hypothetical protein
MHARHDVSVYVTRRTIYLARLPTIACSNCAGFMIGATPRKSADTWRHAECFPRASRSRGCVPVTHNIVQSAHSESGGAPWVTDAARAGLTPDFLTLSPPFALTIRPKDSSSRGKIFGNRKSCFANCEHRSNGNGVIAGEKRRGMRIRGQYLLHRLVATFKGEIPLGEKRLIEPEVCRFKSDAITFETAAYGYVLP